MIFSIGSDSIEDDDDSESETEITVTNVPDNSLNSGGVDIIYPKKEQILNLIPSK